MKRINSIETSGGRQPNWARVLTALLVGFAVVQWSFGPLLGWVRPDATEIERYLIVKGVTLAWIAVVILRSTGWAAVGLRAPLRPVSAVYGAPILLLGAAALSGGAAPTMDSGTLVATAVFVMLGVLGEEVIFRGVMWELVAARGAVYAAMTTSLGFGMIHALGFGGEVPNSIVAAQICFAVGTGVVLAAVRIAAGTLWTAIAVHWGFNMSSFVASGGVAATLSPGMELQFVSAGAALGLVGLAGVVLAERRARRSHRAVLPMTR